MPMALHALYEKALRHTLLHLLSCCMNLHISLRAHHAMNLQAGSTYTYDELFFLPGHIDSGSGAHEASFYYPADDPDQFMLARTKSSPGSNTGEPQRTASAGRVYLLGQPWRPHWPSAQQGTSGLPSG